MSGINCSVKYNSFLNIAVVKIQAQNVTLPANTNVRDVVVLPDKIKINSIFANTQALNDIWQPINNHLYISFGQNEGLTIRSNTVLSNATIVDTFFIPAGSWWLA